MPYPNNHACLLDDSLTVVGSMTREHNGKRYTVRIGKPKGGGGSKERSFLYPKEDWTEESARAHCKDKGGRFEPASQTQEGNPAEYADPGKNPLIKSEEEK